ncbi:unnamed protein product [Phaedon cochleariae]|uniref:Uncharacterized protein n=1 Tax=Phaedon cochleariae TaxID=80249 RepID=A0A9N9X378_PHACE|nr:unnamed protein product [Phaedon cochleariae]
MELERGTCFCCGLAQVISVLPKNKIQKILVSLFTEKIFNINALRNCAALVRLCPSCLHKLILLKETSEKIQSNSKTAVEASHNCSLCGGEELIVKISQSWSNFKEISVDFSLFANEKEIFMCAGCIFYLDSRNAVKIKLCTEYPQLKEVPKLKLKLREHSTPISTKKTHLKMANEEPIEINDSSSDSEAFKLDLSPLKGFKALKYEKLFKNSRLISGDSKFLNQILFIKVNKDDFISMNLIDGRDQNNPKINPDESVSPKLTTSRNIARRTKRSIEKSTSAIMENKPECTSLVENETISTPKKYSRIIRNSPNSDSSTGSPESRSTSFFKIKLKKNSKLSKRTKKQRIDHKKKYKNLTATNFDKKLIINIERHVVLKEAKESLNEEHQSEEDDIVRVEQIESEEKSNIETSMEILFLEADNADSEKKQDDSSEKLEEKQCDGSPENEDESICKENGQKDGILNSSDMVTDTNFDEAAEASSKDNDEEECEGGLGIVNDESQKEITSEEAVSEGTNIDKTCNTEEDDDEITIIVEEESKDCTETTSNTDKENEVYSENIENCDVENESTKNDGMKEVTAPAQNTDGDENKSDDHSSRNFPEEESGLKTEGDQTTDDKTGPEGELEGNKDDESSDIIIIEDSENIKSHQEDETDESSRNKENVEDNVLDDEDKDNSEEKDNDLNGDNQVMQNDSDLGNKESNTKSVENSNSKISEDTSIDDDVSTECKKRKCNDSPEDASSPDRKKKKVTFSDVVLESDD